MFTCSDDQTCVSRRSCLALSPLDPTGAESEWLGDDYPIADIANWCGVRTYRWSVVLRDGLINLDRWLEAMKAMPALRKGVTIPDAGASRVNDEKGAMAFTERARSIVNP